MKTQLYLFGLVARLVLGQWSNPYIKFVDSEYLTFHYRQKHPIEVIEGDDTVSPDERMFMALGNPMNSRTFCETERTKPVYLFIKRGEGKSSYTPDQLERQLHGDLPSSMLSNRQQSANQPSDYNTLRTDYKILCSHYVTNLDIKKHQFWIIHTKPEFQQIIINFDSGEDRQLYFHFTCNYYKSRSPSWTVSKGSVTVFVYTESSCLFRYPVLELFAGYAWLFGPLLTVSGIGLGVFGSRVLKRHPVFFKFCLMFVVSIVIMMMMNELNFERSDTTLWIFASFMLICVAGLNTLMFENGFLLVVCELKRRTGDHYDRMVCAAVPVPEL